MTRKLDLITPGECKYCHKIRLLFSLGLCKECLEMIDERLDRQKETGRCDWCGHYVDECECDDTPW